MIRTILVPLNGSPLAARALGCAVQVARAAGGRVLLVRAAFALPGSVPDREGEAVAVERAHRDLVTIVDRLRHQGVAAECMVRGGDAVAAIVDAASEQHADLVVMSTHGRSGGGRWIYGSVADHVLRRLSIPVLLVPASCEAERQRHGRPPCMLVLLDGSHFSEQILGPAGEFAATLGGTVVLLRVAKRDADVDLVRTYLKEVALRPELQGRVVETCAESGDVVENLRKALGQRRGVDVVALATHGLSGWAHVLMGGTAAQVLRYATSPLLLVRPVGLRQGTARSAARFRSPGNAPEPPVALAFSDLERSLLLSGVELLRRTVDPASDEISSLDDLIARLRSNGDRATTARGG